MTAESLADPTAPEPWLVEDELHEGEEADASREVDPRHEAEHGGEEVKECAPEARAPQIQV